MLAKKQDNKIISNLRKEWKEANDRDQFIDGQDIDEDIADWWISRIKRLYEAN